MRWSTRLSSRSAYSKDSLMLPCKFNHRVYKYLCPCHKILHIPVREGPDAIVVGADDERVPSGELDGTLLSLHQDLAQLLDEPCAVGIDAVMRHALRPEDRELHLERVRERRDPLEGPVVQEDGGHRSAHREEQVLHRGDEELVVLQQRIRDAG